MKPYTYPFVAAFGVALVAAGGLGLYAGIDPEPWTRETVETAVRLPPQLAVLVYLLGVTIQSRPADVWFLLLCITGTLAPWLPAEVFVPAVLSLFLFSYADPARAAEETPDAP